ncbi:MAG: hypothetical protein JNJ73_06445 [Hyphomonadaceae bacterium]|nr:hypothetical protein [Hyphomonadaceae bacterium]
MSKLKRALASGARLPERADLRERALGALRPGVEALLLAAVALGTAQAGWNALTPHVSYASPETPGPDVVAIAPQAEAVGSPFSPALDGSTSNAASALLANVKLAGVRVADDPARSGCILTLEDGAQHAFLIGQEIMAGVTLAEVTPDFVLLAHDGGQAQLTLEERPSFSFARALMGVDQLEYSDAPAEYQDEEAEEAAPPAEALDGEPVGPPAIAEVEEIAPAPAMRAAARAPAAEALEAEPQQTTYFEPVAPTVVTPESLDWLPTTLAVPVSIDGHDGWSVASPPAAAETAGVAKGDFILDVNGAGPDQLMDAMRAATTGDVQLSVMRGGERVTLRLAADGPA